MTQLVSIINNQVKTTSIIVAETFGKRHCDVLRRIEDLETPIDFNQRNFALVEYVDAKGEARKAYEITRDGFTLLAMGFTGKKAMQFKIAYIEAFNKMEQALMTEQAIQPVIAFEHSTETKKMLGGMIKRCCASAVKEALITDDDTALRAMATLVNYIVDRRVKTAFQAKMTEVQKLLTV